MPRGLLTQEDVWKACDALLQEGARPTTERLKQQLGRGTASQIGAHVESWFQQLGTRIKDQKVPAAPLDVPEPALKAAKYIWDKALMEAQRGLEERVRDSTAGALAQVEAERARATRAEAQAAEAGDALARLQAALAERDARPDQDSPARAETEARLLEAHQQIHELRARLSQAETELNNVRNAAKRHVAMALQRATISDQRAALQSEAEHAERQKLEERIEDLEKKLRSMIAASQGATRFKSSV